MRTEKSHLCRLTRPLKKQEGRRLGKFCGQHKNKVHKLPLSRSSRTMCAQTEPLHREHLSSQTPRAWVEEMAQRVRALSTLLEDAGFILSIHIMA